MKDAIVFAKVDMNVPIDKSTGKIFDIEKIKDAVKCIQWCFGNEAYAVVAISHQGRKKEESLKDHAKVIEEFFPNKVKFCECISNLPNEVKNTERGDIIVLENIRSLDDEKDYTDVTQTALYKAVKEIENQNGRKIVYVKDDLAVCHRKDLSVYALPLQLKKEGYKIVAGPCIIKEIESAKVARQKMKENKMICIWGGMKFDDYIHLFETVLLEYPRAIILVTGPMSALFLKALGRDIGENEKIFGIEPELVERVKPVIEGYGTRIIMPMDFYVETPKGRKVISTTEPLNGLIVDIGPDTVKNFKHFLKINPNSLVIGNGPLGQYEKGENAKGTFEVYSEIFNGNNSHFLIGGGGDFNAVMNMMKKEPHIRSSGGKAFLELLVHGKLCGLEPLEMCV